MNILLITGPYPPEIRAISFMMQELADGLTARGHRVTVATCWPQYNLTREAEGRTFSAVTVENGVRVIRVKTLPIHKSVPYIRALAQLSLPRLFLREIGRTVREKIDAVIVYSPPLTLGLAGLRVKERYGATYILNIQDIFPQNAIDLGFVKNRFLIHLLERMEQTVYAAADAITSHTKSSRRFLIEKRGIPEGKIGVIPNWIDMDIFKGVQATGAFRARYNLQEKFIFLFAGIMGPAQDLGFLVEVATRVADIPDICFLFVGDGVEKKALQRMVKERDLKNVLVEPFVSKEEYPFLAKEADVGLASLSMHNRTPVIPGKIIVSMALALPIVAFLNRESDAHELVRQARCGYTALSNDPEKAADLIKTVYNTRRELTALGENGRDYARRNFSKKACLDAIEQLLLRRVVSATGTTSP